MILVRRRTWSRELTTLAREPSEVGRQGVRLHFELLDGILSGNDGENVEVGIVQWGAHRGTPRSDPRRRRQSENCPTRTDFGRKDSGATHRPPCPAAPLQEPTRPAPADCARSRAALFTFRDSTTCPSDEVSGCNKGVSPFTSIVCVTAPASNPLTSIRTVLCTSTVMGSREKRLNPAFSISTRYIHGTRFTNSYKPSAVVAIL